MKRAMIGIFGQTERIGDFHFFDIGSGKSYFSEKKPRILVEFIQLLNVLEKTAHAKASIFLSGPILERLTEQQIVRMQALLEEQRLELLGGPYHESVSCLLSFTLFKTEVMLQAKKLQALFGIQPQGFVNSAAIFADDLSSGVKKLGFAYAVVPRVPWFKHSGQSGSVFRSPDSDLRLVLTGASADNALEVTVGVDFNAKSFVSHHAYYTLSELVEEQSAAEKKYSLPSVVACDVQQADFSSFIGNSLQLQAFRKLKKMAEALKSKIDDLSEADLTSFLRLSHLAHFRALREANDQRHVYYLNLMNALADFEVTRGI